eukprot:COSAG06_NODE_5394_length_3508_cov_2.144324_1_plen_32_part_00
MKHFSQEREMLGMLFATTHNAFGDESESSSV